MSRLWCVEHQENHTMTANEIERVIYWTQWSRADVMVHGVLGREEAPDGDDELDHFQCPEEILEWSMDPTRAGHEVVEDNVERRVRHDQAVKAAGGTLK